MSPADLAAARREAEEALEEHDVAVAGDEWSFAPISLTVADALRALLAASEPAPATTCTLCDYGIELRGSGLHSVTPNVFILCAKVLKRAPEPAPALPDEVREAAERLRDKMRTTYADTRYMNVWATAQERLGPYTGPNWIAEAEALDAALASRGGRS